MNQDLFWQMFRGLLLMAGGYLVQKGLTDEATMQAAATALLTLAVFGWGLYVKYGTRTVSAAVVDRSKIDPTVPTIPTISPATGAVEKVTL